MTKSAQRTKVAEASTVMARPAKQEQLIKLLNRKTGATIEHIQRAIGWLPHTARAAISRLRMAGISVERTDADNGALYRIVAEA